MAGSVLNLNRFRKRKAQLEKEKKAGEQRVRHGRSKVEKMREKREQALAERVFDGHVRDKKGESPEGMVEKEEGPKSSERTQGTPLQHEE